MNLRSGTLHSAVLPKLFELGGTPKAGRSRAAEPHNGHSPAPLRGTSLPSFLLR
jgi:hypothetical protein